MSKRFAAPVASAATAILLSLAGLETYDDSLTTTTLAADGRHHRREGRGRLEFVGDDTFGGQTLSIDVVEENGEVSGEFSISDIVFVRVDRAETSKWPSSGSPARLGWEGDPTHLGEGG